MRGTGPIRGRGLIAGAMLAVGAYACLIWFDLPRPGIPDDIPSPEAGMRVGALSWFDQIHGLRGWGGFYGSGGTGAYYVHLPAPAAYRFLPLLAVLGAAGVLLARVIRRPPRSPWRALAVLVVLGYAAQFTALLLHSDNPSGEVTTRVYSPIYGGYVRAADVFHGASTFFSGYERLLETRHGDQLCQVHCGTHPPGAVLAFWVPIRVLRALPQGPVDSIGRFVAHDLRGAAPPPGLSTEGGIAAWLGGHLMMLAAASIVLPLFGIARRLAGPRLALPLAALGLSIPAMLHFAPVYDQLWAVAAATLIYLALRGLTATGRALPWGLAAGVVVGLSTYASLQLAVLAVPLAAMALAAVVGRLPVGPGALHRTSRAHVLRWLAGVAAGGAAPWLLAWVGGLDVPAVIDTARQNHVASTLASRPYWPWVLFDVSDFVQMLGLPLAVAAVAASLRRHANLYGLLFLGLVAVLDVSGSVRGETGRIWLFLTPLALTTLYVAAGRRAIGPRGVAALLASQALLSVLMEARWSYSG